jgi:hypothetical protein
MIPFLLQPATALANFAYDPNTGYEYNITAIYDGFNIVATDAGSGATWDFVVLTNSPYYNYYYTQYGGNPYYSNYGYYGYYGYELPYTLIYSQNYGTNGAYYQGGNYGRNGTYYQGGNYGRSGAYYQGGDERSQHFQPTTQSTTPSRTVGSPANTVSWPTSDKDNLPSGESHEQGR